MMLNRCLSVGDVTLTSMGAIPTFNFELNHSIHCIHVQLQWDVVRFDLKCLLHVRLHVYLGSISWCVGKRNASKFLISTMLVDDTHDCDTSHWKIGKFIQIFKWFLWKPGKLVWIAKGSTEGNRGSLSSKSEASSHRAR